MAKSYVEHRIWSGYYTTDDSWHRLLPSRTTGSPKVMLLRCAIWSRGAHPLQPAAATRRIADQTSQEQKVPRTNPPAAAPTCGRTSQACRNRDSQRGRPRRTPYSDNQVLCARTRTPTGRKDPQAGRRGLHQGRNSRTDATGTPLLAGKARGLTHTEAAVLCTAHRNNACHRLLRCASVSSSWACPEHCKSG